MRPERCRTVEPLMRLHPERDRKAFKKGLGLIQCTALVTNLILVENGAAPEGQAALEPLRRGDQLTECWQTRPRFG
jgi:hypothetical protein